MGAVCNIANLEKVIYEGLFSALSSRDQIKVVRLCGRCHGAILLGLAVFSFYIFLGIGFLDGNASKVFYSY